MAPPSGESKKTLLIVEDDADVRAMLVRALSQLYAVSVAANGQEALALVTTMAPADAIISDVMMPGMDGYALARRIKATTGWSHVPILFLTARGAPKDIAAGINAGARHYVVKPFKIAEVLEKLGRMVGVKT
jgi:CheY-like chemotaxis protein